jgi:hypothetical protein
MTKSERFEKGAGAPHSKTLSRSLIHVDIPKGFGERQTSAAFAEVMVSGT